MNAIKGFFNLFIGNRGPGGEVIHSSKKVFYTIASATAYIVPHVLLYFDVITGTDWLSFYKIIVPSTLALYVGGKAVDNGFMNGGPK